MSPQSLRKVTEIYMRIIGPLACHPVGKMLESIIRDKIVSYLERYSLIRDSQHGVRYRGSCLFNLLTFYNDLFSVHYISKYLYIVYLDFQKAFDKIPHSK